MKILVFGKGGQLAQSLAERQPAKLNPTFLSREDCELRDPEMIRSILSYEKPDFIVNAAAYTGVDQAELESEVAIAINATAPCVMASWASENNSKLIHISTDFVFDGMKKSPYKPEDKPAPMGSYGKSKALGELRVMEVARDNVMIIRTAWVYSEYGNNFVKKMLHLMGERDSVSVVNDQRGSPTYAGSIARVIWQIIHEDRFKPGIYHWTDCADVTWYGFAKQIQQEAIKLGLLERKIPIFDISTEKYPTPATRPNYSVLDTTSMRNLLDKENEDWRSNLRVALNRIASQI